MTVPRRAIAPVLLGALVAGVVLAARLFAIFAGG
jgi:hypothetical protein